MIKSIHAIAKGKVQGVGFRYTAVDLATNLSLGGYAKNMQDGNVELLVQGDVNRIDTFFKELGSRYDCEFMKNEVDNEEEHPHFRIAYNSNS